jgi:hypothetical protein
MHRRLRGALSRRRSHSPTLPRISVTSCQPKREAQSNERLEHACALALGSITDFTTLKTYTSAL